MESPGATLSSARLQMMAQDNSMTILRILEALKNKQAGKKEQQKTIVEFQPRGDIQRAAHCLASLGRDRRHGRRGTRPLLSRVPRCAVRGHHLGSCLVSGSLRLPIESPVIRWALPGHISF